MSDHIVKSYDADLQNLRRMIGEMGGLAERMLSDATQALASRDMDLAQRVITLDPRLDALQREIEEKSVLTIAKRQPLATDLREVIAAIRIASDLERVGDLAKNIAKRVVAIAGQFHPARIVKGVEHMSDLVLEQLKDVLDAYTTRDQERSVDVWTRDGDIDVLYNSLFRELLTYMMEDPRNITFCTHLLFAAKNVERIGDHSTNIAETVYYLATGNSLPTDRPKFETTINSTSGMNIG
jgi:phosphate transport system protein